MIFMSVGNEKSFNSVSIAFDIRKVGNHIINSGHIGIGKRHSAIENYHIVTVFKNGKIFTYFVYSAEKCYADAAVFFKLLR